MKPAVLLWIAAAVVLPVLGQTSAGAATAAGVSGAKKKAEAPKIDGMEIARANGTFLGLKVADGRFKLTFYDKQKKPATPDVARVALRWSPRNEIGQQRVVLGPGDDPHALGSDRVIRPPYNFKLFMVFLNTDANGNEQVVESLVVDFRQ